jgi:hypothetical protein
MEHVDSIHMPRLCPLTFFTLMSSPSGYWDDNKISPAILNELVAIEASQVASTSKSIVWKPSVILVPPPLTVVDSNDLFDLSFDASIQNFQMLDAAIEWLLAEGRLYVQVTIIWDI